MNCSSSFFACATHACETSSLSWRVPEHAAATSSSSRGYRPVGFVTDELEEMEQMRAELAKTQDEADMEIADTLGNNIFATKASDPNHPEFRVRSPDSTEIGDDPSVRDECQSSCEADSPRYFSTPLSVEGSVGSASSANSARSELLMLKAPTSRRTRGTGVVLLDQTEAVEAMLNGFRSKWASEGSDDKSFLTREKRQFDVNSVSLMSRQEFDFFLAQHGVIIEEDNGTARSTRDLWLEMIWQTSKLETFPAADAPYGFRMQRSCRILVIELQALINGAEKFLLLSSDGPRANLNQRLTTKMFSDESVEDAFSRCFVQNFGLSGAAGEKHLKVTKSTEHEEQRDSAAFPGLVTTYTMFTLEVSVRDPGNTELAAIGLPSGEVFRPHKKHKAKERTWTWVDKGTFTEAKKGTAGAITSPVRSAKGKLKGSKSSANGCIIS